MDQSIANVGAAIATFLRDVQAEVSNIKQANTTLTERLEASHPRSDERIQKVERQLEVNETMLNNVQNNLRQAVTRVEQRTGQVAQLTSDVAQLCKECDAMKQALQTSQKQQQSTGGDARIAELEKTVARVKKDGLVATAATSTLQIYQQQASRHRKEQAEQLEALSVAIREIKAQNQELRKELAGRDVRQHDSPMADAIPEQAAEGSDAPYVAGGLNSDSAEAEDPSSQASFTTARPSFQRGASVATDMTFGRTPQPAARGASLQGERLEAFRASNVIRGLSLDNPQETSPKKIVHSPPEPHNPMRKKQRVDTAADEGAKRDAFKKPQVPVRGGKRPVRRPPGSTSSRAKQGSKNNQANKPSVIAEYVEDEGDDASSEIIVTRRSVTSAASDGAATSHPAALEEKEERDPSTADADASALLASFGVRTGEVQKSASRAASTAASVSSARSSRRSDVFAREKVSGRKQLAHDASMEVDDDMTFHPMPHPNKALLHPASLPSPSDKGNREEAPTPAVNGTVHAGQQIGAGTQKAQSSTPVKRRLRQNPLKSQKAEEMPWPKDWKKEFAKESRRA
ncbi:uncharacterized protein LTR77_009928 [Saxophila tyrrhenica]|uniref:Uncharacterized protein n=1 Tax=Saxophila tyrrhenica TaxID=1690608 RepID=A0AAV9NWD8_9PEZI|nr:hypothetical protein LTR77_009928 [Saxophila tyrrhenica]